MGGTLWQIKDQRGIGFASKNGGLMHPAGCSTKWAKQLYLPPTIQALAMFMVTCAASQLSAPSKGGWAWHNPVSKQPLIIYNVLSFFRVLSVSHDVSCCLRCTPITAWIYYLQSISYLGWVHSILNYTMWLYNLSLHHFHSTSVIYSFATEHEQAMGKYSRVSKRKDSEKVLWSFHICYSASVS